MPEICVFNGSEHGGKILYIVATPQDLERLDAEIEDLADIELEFSDVFFRFENYPEIVSLVNLERAVRLAGHMRRFFLDNPGQKYWLSINKDLPAHGSQGNHGNNHGSQSKSL